VGDGAEIFDRLFFCLAFAKISTKKTTSNVVKVLLKWISLTHSHANRISFRLEYKNHYSFSYLVDFVVVVLRFFCGLLRLLKQ
jgi:hypothetical protein